MRRYQYHKQVSAAKLTAIDFQDDVRGWVLSFENGHVSNVGQVWIDKHRPEVGGYYVLYDDGYASYSPAAAFDVIASFAPDERAPD